MQREFMIYYFVEEWYFPECDIPKYKRYNFTCLSITLRLNWFMHPVARVSINKYRNLRTQQMLVHSLVCIFLRHVSAPIGDHLQVVCNMKFRR
jgi:hypothetical protein